ncbi:M1 family aminopeptidase [Flavobacterium sp.]|uniref:M1 family aminopeptidase n=1 Tax=Flavobacterium sp. TaxID=239 RepID=UPI00286E7A22|nr:M1 family aminopeptidase [Flavobacterium sp.]
MKKITCILLFVPFFVFSQTEKTRQQKMVESEMKSASNTINFRVNPNTLNYDITYHKLEFTVNPAVASITGKVTTTYTALSNINTVTFDLSNVMTVSSVKKGTISLAYTRSASNELIITLPSTQASGTSETLEINYSGNPTTTGFGSFQIDTHGTTPFNTKPVLWTLSEPYGARDWWPCKQDLNDKINNIDVYITAPSAYKSVSNGLEIGTPVTSGVNKITHFQHNYPIPAYLIAIAVTNYQIHNQQGGTATTGFFPIVNYMYPETATANIASVAVTPTIINFFESILGPYPFRNEKYGHAEFGWGGGMEHTTVSFMTSYDGSGAYDRELISHEMGHQWFGNKITCGSWKDIWLNEGITEYMSGCVVEHLDGAAAFKNWKTIKINNITSQTSGNVYLTDAQLTSVNRIFSLRLTYDKGSMVSNMLRFKMGSTAYFQGLRDYLSDSRYAYAYAITPEFQAKMETLYGSPGSLQEFFNDWIYNQGYPTYSINAYNSGAGQATVQINQTQSDASVTFFEMPVPVRLTGAAGAFKDVVLDNTTNGQTFQVPVTFTVTGVEFDRDKNIISKDNTTTLGVENFNFAASIKMYPNPSTAILNIDMPSSITLNKVSLFNTLGQKTLESNQNRIDVSGQASGIYIVSFETSEGTFHKNFIKK